MGKRRSYIMPQVGEEWRKVTFYEDYLISNFGRVVNSKTGHLHKPVVRQHKAHPTLDVALYNAYGRSSVRVAEMVLRAFGENTPDNTTNLKIIYFDGDYTNCKFENLEWFVNLKDKVRITKRKKDEVVVYTSWEDVPTQYSRKYISRISDTNTKYFGWTWTVENWQQIIENDKKQHKQ